MGKFIKKLSHKNIGTCAVFVYFSSGMASHKSTDFYVNFSAGSVHTPDWQIRISSNTTSAAYPQTALFFRIQIDHSSSLQKAAVESVSAQKPRLFIDGENNLQSRMRQICTV